MGKADVLQLILQQRQQEQDDTYQYVAVMVEDNIATLDKISQSTVHNFGNTVQPVVASWGYNTHAQLMTVLLKNTNQYITKEIYIVLPPLPNASATATATAKVESSTINVSKAEADAKYCKENDTTGSSLSLVFDTSFLS